MKYVIIIFALFISATGFSQEVKKIRFIKWGQESKPIGTVLISTQHLEKPNDKVLDYKVGISIKTDSITFDCLMDFVNQNKILDIDPEEPDFVCYVIKTSDNDKGTHFLNQKSEQVFFDDLKEMITRYKLDQKVLIPFERFYSD